MDTRPCPGTSQGPARPLRGGAPWSRRSPTAPAHAEGAGLLTQAAPSTPAPMNPDQTNEDSAETPKWFMQRPGGASTAACNDISPLTGPRGLRYPPQGPPCPALWAGHVTACPRDCYEGMEALLGHPLALPGAALSGQEPLGRAGSAPALPSGPLRWDGDHFRAPLGPP